jgi:hypothetical protein
MVSLLLFFEDTLLPLVKEKKKRQSLENKKAKGHRSKVKKKQAIFLDIGEKRKKVFERAWR